MRTEEAIRLTREHVERQFPKTCGKCGATFGSLADYLRRTRHLGQPISFDEERGDHKPKKPFGVFSFANCKCGTTLSITSEGMKLLTLWRLMLWARSEAKRRGVKWRDVLEWVRGEVDRQVLSRGRTSRPKNS